MTLDLDHLEALAKAATPGEWRQHDPWTVAARDKTGDTILLVDTHDLDTDYVQQERDAAYIAAANPAPVLELIAGYRRLNADINKYAYERDKAREERDAAERRSEQFWKPQVELAEAEIKRLREALQHIADQNSPHYGSNYARAALGDTHE